MTINSGSFSHPRRPAPPFTHDSALEKVRLAENGWNSGDAEKVALAYTWDCEWRNRAEIVRGRVAVVNFLTREWKRQLEFRLIKELWAYDGCRIAVRFASEWHDGAGKWARSYGNENWEFEADGLMRRRYASINDVFIVEAERMFFWDAATPRPLSHAGLTELGLWNVGAAFSQSDQRPSFSPENAHSFHPPAPPHQARLVISHHEYSHSQYTETRR